MEPARTGNEETTFRIEGNRLAISGEIDVAVVDEFAHAMSALIEANPSRPLHVDLAAVTFIDSSGLGVLVGANKQASATGSSIRLEHVQEAPAKVFEITGLQEIFGLA